MNTSEVDRLLVDITRIQHLSGEVLEVLNAQQNVLRMRSIQLDTQLIHQLGYLTTEINQLLQHLEGQQPELARLRALVRAMSAFNSTLNLTQILDDVMDNFIALTQAERGLIVLLDPETREMEFRVVRGMDVKSITKVGFMVSKTVVEDVARSGKAVMTDNALEDDRYSAQESIISMAARSILCVPLKIGEQVIGVAYADHRFRNELFGNQEMKFLEGYANQAAIAIENARLYDNVQQRLREISEIRKFLDNIFNSIVSGVITLDNDGIVMTANRAAEDILGLRGDLGKHYREIFPPLYDGFGELLEEVRLNRLQQIIEINPLLPERGPVYLYMRLSPLIDTINNRTQGVAIVIDDLTELKKQDETLKVVNTYLSKEMVSNIHSIDQLGLGGETRDISAIFADVRGFTTFSERLEPEELMSVINQYLTVSSEAIQYQEGVIDKFMGDAVLGLFNTQLNPHSDYALRAVYAAIRMVADVFALHQQLPPKQQLLYGIGIHTAPATIGNIGSPSRKEFTAIGEAIDYAKKLQECALGGEIILSAETYECVKAHVDCVLVERQMRGESAITQAYLVQGLK